MREEELRTQNRRFELALANMPQGLCMVERKAASRLQQALCGHVSRARRAYLPGTSLEDI